MAKVIRAAGTTESERYLARLADKTFLNLWAYPNVYRDTIVNGHRAGKELCDLLVVCGGHVIIFSDKHIQWPEGNDVNLSWSRWYKRAIKKSVAQIRGAERWIAEHPERLFLDAACTQALPLPLPPAGRRIVSGVVVAIGAYEACRKFFAVDRGSFMVRPSLHGDAHIDTHAQGYQPFTIGDVDPSGSFIHVLNDVTLDIVMGELDSVSDFTAYLERKAAFIRFGNLMGAAGEEELLMQYLTKMDGDEHGFVHPEGRPWKETDRVSFDVGFYDRMLQNKSYRRKKEADKISYMWDRLIEAFTGNMLEGTTIVPEGQAFVLSEVEVAVRQMALKTRTQRRMLSNAIRGVLEVAHNEDRAFRAMIPAPAQPEDGIGYAFMTAAVPDFPLEGGYDQYRKVRINMLEAYCLKVLQRSRHLNSIIGIAMEPPAKPGGPKGSSEDLLMIGQPEVWTPEFEQKLEETAKFYNIMQKATLRTKGFNAAEYPESVGREREQFRFAGYAAASEPEKRAEQRKRANTSKLGRNSPCPCGSGKKYKKCCGS